MITSYFVTVFDSYELALGQIFEHRLCSRPYENAAVLEQLGRCTSTVSTILERT